MAPKTLTKDHKVVRDAVMQDNQTTPGYGHRAGLPCKKKHKVEVQDALMKGSEHTPAKKSPGAVLPSSTKNEKQRKDLPRSSVITMRKLAWEDSPAMAADAMAADPPNAMAADAMADGQGPPTDTEIENFNIELRARLGLKGAPVNIDAMADAMAADSPGPAAMAADAMAADQPNPMAADALADSHGPDAMAMAADGPGLMAMAADALADGHGPDAMADAMAADPEKDTQDTWPLPGLYESPDDEAYKVTDELPNDADALGRWCNGAVSVSSYVQWCKDVVPVALVYSCYAEGNATTKIIDVLRNDCYSVVWNADNQSMPPPGNDMIYSIKLVQGEGISSREHHVVAAIERGSRAAWLSMLITSHPDLDESHQSCEKCKTVKSILEGDSDSGGLENMMNQASFDQMFLGRDQNVYAKLYDMPVTPS